MQSLLSASSSDGLPGLARHDASSSDGPPPLADHDASSSDASEDPDIYVAGPPCQVSVLMAAGTQYEAMQAMQVAVTWWRFAFELWRRLDSQLRRQFV